MPSAFLSRRFRQINYWCFFTTLEHSSPFSSSGSKALGVPRYSLETVSPLQSLRILIIGLNYFPEPTGIGPYSTALAQGLVARGHRVTVQTTHPHYPEWKIATGYGGWSRREVIEGVHIHRLRHYVPRQPSGIRRLLSELSFGFRSVTTNWDHPDIVVLVSPGLFSSAAVILKLRTLARRTPFVFWVQDLYGLGIVEIGSKAGILSRSVTALEGFLFRSANGVAVIHDRFADHVRTELGVNVGRVKVIRNWTHLTAQPFTSRNETRTALGWGEDEIVALHAGNMGLKQNLENLVEASRIADSRGDNVRFVLMGDGSQRKRLQALARDISRIQLIDPLPELGFLSAMMAADVLIVNEKPGLAEMAVPSKFTSYFSTGLPVIAATDAGSISANELSASGGGIRVDAGDPQAVLDEVIALGLDPLRAGELGSRGLKFRNDFLLESTAIDNYASWLEQTICLSKSSRME